jgi:hypothetical protein
MEPAPDDTQRLRGFAEAILIAGMSLILSAPMIAKATGWPPARDLNEHRVLAAFPGTGTTSLGRWPKAVDAWWNDHFGLRSQIVSLYETFRVSWLRAPGQRYFQGIDGHLFLNHRYGPPLNATVFDYLGAGPRLGPEQIADWTDYLEGKNEWLKAYGIHYLFVLAPNKITVEERFLPEEVRRRKGQSYLEQLRQKVFARLPDDVDWLDLTASLKTGELEEGVPMFKRIGDNSHWNGAGFFTGLKIMDEHLRRFFPQMPPFPEDQISLMPVEGDPTAFSFVWKEDPSIRIAKDSIMLRRRGNWEDPKCSTAEGRKGSLVLISDSSWKIRTGMKIFLPGGHTAFPYQWGHHRHAAISFISFEELLRIVREEHPDVIVEAQTERELAVPDIPPEFRYAAKFRRGRPVSEGGRDTPAENSKVISRVDIEAPGAGTAEVCWRCEEGKPPRNCVQIGLEKGRNVLFVPATVPAGAGCRLFLSSSAVSGRCKVRKFDVREVS